jgi:hypothetical protein
MSSRQRCLLKVLRQSLFLNLTFVSEQTQARTRAGTRNQGAGAGEEEADDMEEDLTDDESVVVQETRPPPNPRRSSGNGYLRFSTPAIVSGNNSKERQKTERHKWHSNGSLNREAQQVPVRTFQYGWLLSCYVTE